MSRCFSRGDAEAQGRERRKEGEKDRRKETELICVKKGLTGYDACCAASAEDLK
jgi:hypothetical protein